MRGNGIDGTATVEFTRDNRIIPGAMVDIGDTRHDSFSNIGTAEDRPSLVVIDIDFPESRTLLKQIKNQWPLIPCILLVDSIEQEESVIDADAVLIKGFPVAKLIGTIEELLSQRENDIRMKSYSKGKS